MRIASLFLLFGLALAQGFLPAPKTKAPLPPWIKPGLLLAYADDVGLMRAVYLVTDVTADTAVGAYLVVASSPNGMAQAQLNFGALVQNGIGPIYVDQNAAARWAEMAAADPNIEVRATPGYLIVTSGEHQVSLVYDPNTGLVLEHAEVFAQNRGQNPPMPNSIHFRLAGRYQLDWPRATSPPAAAQSPHVYQILTRTIVPGYPPIEQVLGELAVSPAGAMPPLYAFQVNVSGPQMPYTGPNQVYGTATYTSTPRSSLARRSSAPPRSGSPSSRPGPASTPSPFGITPFST